MSFLPQDYKSPQTSNFYLKLQEGENRIRIMSAPVMGWEDWDGNNKPIRFRMDDKPQMPLDPSKPVRHFWSFIAFNYLEEQIQIMHITQSKIRKSLEALCRDQDWGDPYGYDIKICKTGKGKETDYSVNPVPHKPMDDYLVKQFREKPCNLDALFMNADPFGSEWKNHTPLGGEAPTAAPSVTSATFTIAGKKYVTEAEAASLELLITECDPLKHKSIREFLQKSCENSPDLRKMDQSVFASMKLIIADRRDKYQQTLKELEEVPF